LGEFGDKTMEAIVSAEADEVVETTIKISTSTALRKCLFHLFFILFVDVDTYDTKLHHNIHTKRNLVTNKITANLMPWIPPKTLLFLFWLAQFVH
jgi:hypothetical protein